MTTTRIDVTDLCFTDGETIRVDSSELMGEDCEGYVTAEPIDPCTLYDYLEDEGIDKDDIPDDLVIINHSVECEDPEIYLDLCGVCDCGPMMNFVYPLPDFRGDLQDASKLEGPVCLVRFSEENQDKGLPEFGLALTGGGMDLSWDIAWAYICLGFVPPQGVVRRLPMYGGMKLTDKAKTIIDAMRREAIRVIQNAKADLSDLKRVENHCKKNGGE